LKYKIKYCHDNFCRYTGLDGQSKYNNLFTQLARAILNIQLTVLTFRIAINFAASSAGQYTVQVRDKNGLWHSNRRSLFIDVPQILYAKRRWI
jgi:hypothetical protein